MEEKEEIKKTEKELVKKRKKEEKDAKYSEHIVKAKDINVDIMISEKENKKNLSIIIAGELFLVAIFASFTILLNNLILAISLTIILCILLVIADIETLKNDCWNLIIKDRNLYILYKKKKYIISYQDLVNFKDTFEYYSDDINSHMRYYLIIEYLEDNTLKKIRINHSEEMQEEVDYACSAFITNTKLEKESDIDLKDFFDITNSGKEETIKSQKWIERKKDEKEFKIKVYLVVGAVIIFIGMLTIEEIISQL